MTTLALQPAARRRLFALLASSLAALPALAVDYSWNGTAGVWSSTTRWSPNGTPGAGDNIVTPTQFTTLTVDVESRTVQNWTHGGPGAWLINITNGSAGAENNFSIGITGSLTQSAGTLSFRNNGDATSYLGLLSVNAGQINLSGGTLNFGDASRFLHHAGSGATAVSSASGSTILNLNTTTASLGHVTLSAAAGSTALINLHNASTSTTNVAYRKSTIVEAASLSTTSTAGNAVISAGNTGQGTVMGATLRLTADSGSATFGGRLVNNHGASSSRTLALEKTGAGEQILTGANTYTGNTTVSGGRLIIDGAGTIATSAAFVQNGGTLGGTGTAGDITLAAGGALDPTSVTDAFDAASLTWNGETAGSFSQMLFALGTTDNASDRLSLSGSLFKGTGDTFSFDFGGGGVAGATYTLVSFAGTTFDLADFSYGNLGAGLAGTFSLDANNLRFAVTSAIPEPSAAALLVGSLSLAATGRRRRRRA